MEATIEKLKLLFEDTQIVGIEPNNESDEGIIIFVQTNDHNVPIKSIKIGFSSCEGYIEVNDEKEYPTHFDRVF